MRFAYFRLFGPTTEGEGAKRKLRHRHLKQRLRVLGALLGVATLLVPLSVNAATLTTIFTFDGKDGATPEGSLLAVGSVLYGTTNTGGTGGAGTVFGINRFTNRAHSYSFPGGFVDGGSPSGNLTDVGGVLYGVGSNGGTNSTGVIYALDPTSGIETIVHSFGPQGGPDGALPFAGLLDVGGILYGTTALGGGRYDLGTVYSFNPKNGFERVVHSFTAIGTDGATPYAGLINVGGTLYGATYYGGAFGCGTIFAFDPTTKITTVLYSFTGGADGSNPYGPLTSIGNVLYGTTQFGGNAGCELQYGCGAAFMLDLSTGEFTTIYSFAGSPDAGNPNSLTSVNGKLFGTAGDGSSGFGAIFQIDPTTGVEQVVYSFTGGSDGAGAASPLIEVDHALWGVTGSGGSYAKHCVQFGCGTVFKLTP